MEELGQVVGGEFGHWLVFIGGGGDPRFGRMTGVFSRMMWGLERMRAEVSSYDGGVWGL